jgi:hypothetical protein
MTSDLSEYILVGAMIITSPLWLPFYLTGWAGIRIYMCLEELKNGR